MNNVQSHLNKAIDINPEFAEAHFELSLILINQGKYEDAKDHLLKVIKIDSEFMQAYFHLALIFLLNTVFASIPFRTHHSATNLSVFWSLPIQVQLS